MLATTCCSPPPLEDWLVEFMHVALLRAAPPALRTDRLMFERRPTALPMKTPATPIRFCTLLATLPPLLPLLFGGGADRDDHHASAADRSPPPPPPPPPPPSRAVGSVPARALELPAAFGGGAEEKDDTPRAVGRGGRRCLAKRKPPVGGGAGGRLSGNRAQRASS